MKRQTPGSWPVRNTVYGSTEEVYPSTLRKVCFSFQWISFSINKNIAEPINDQILFSPAWNVSFKGNIYGYIGQIQIIEGD